MESGSDSIKRKPIVCARMGCSRCNDIVLGRPVPDDCEYGIIHLMDTSEDILQQPRGAGKTTMLVKSAIELAKRFDILYVCPKIEMSRPAQVIMMSRCAGIPKRIKFMSLGQIRNGSFRGLGPRMLILDEVRPQDVERWLVPKSCYPIALARWT